MDPNTEPNGNQALPCQGYGFAVALRRLSVFLGIFLVLDQALGWVLLRGLEKYFRLGTHADVLCIGHSHTVLGIDRTKLEHQTGLKVVKFAMQGANNVDRGIMLQYFLSRQPFPPKIIIYDVSGHTFTDDNLSANSYQLFFPYVGEPLVREYLRKHCRSDLEFWLRRFLASTRYQEASLALSLRGYLGREDNLKWNRLDVPRLALQIEQGDYRRIQLNQESMLQVQENIRVALASGAQVVLLYIPTVDLLNRAEAEMHQKVVRQLEEFSQRMEGVHYLDYNRILESQHELFADPIHMNPEGQKRVTEMLGKDLKDILH